MASGGESEFFLVLSKERNPIYDKDGDVLIQRRIDGTQYYVNPDCIATDDVDMEENNKDNDNNDISCPEEKKNWTRSDILKLIREYQNNKENFASTSIKNIKVWQMIAKVVRSHSARQCENKFKYLKSKYLKKIDNMSQRSSGAGTVKFEYFEEFDEIFKKDPAVEPVAIASSSRDNTPHFEMETQRDDEEVGVLPPRQDAADNRNQTPRSRHIKLKDALVNLNSILKEAEERKEKRHREMVNLQKETMEIFKNLMEKLIEQ